LDIRGDGSHPVKAPDSGGELVAFFAFEEQLGDFFASPLIAGRSYRLFFLFLVLIMNGAEAILGIDLLVLCFRVFGFDLPNTLLLQRKRSPAVTCSRRRKI
jgi:hypothetical protein